MSTVCGINALRSQADEELGGKPCSGQGLPYSLWVTCSTLCTVTLCFKFLWQFLHSKTKILSLLSPSIEETLCKQRAKSSLTVQRTLFKVQQPNFTHPEAIWNKHCSCKITAGLHFLPVSLYTETFFCSDMHCLYVIWQLFGNWLHRQWSIHCHSIKIML